MSNWPSSKANRVLSALQDIGWRIKRQSGSHKTLSREGWPDYETITADSSNPSANHMGQKAMSRVTGIGGIFLGAKDPAMLRAWYKKHLGIDVQEWGGAAFRWVDGSGHPTAGTTAWFIGNGENFAPSTAPFMVNYRVSDLHGLLAALRAEGCNVLEKTEESDDGKFGWVMDPEGNKVELWQPSEGK